MIRIRNESNMQIIIGKAGQVSLWVIIAIAIVAIVGLLALLRQKPLPEIDNIESPERTIESCARDAIYETVKLMAPQGGFVSPRNYKKYDNINVAYLCENIGYFETCINQHPSLLAEIKEEIYNNSINKIENCFVDSTEELKKKNIKVESGETNLKIDLAPQRIKVSINKKMTLSSKEGTKNIEDFNFEIRHPLYELALVANEIASQEAKYCNKKLRNTSRNMKEKINYKKTAVFEIVLLISVSFAFAYIINHTTGNPGEKIIVQKNVRSVSLLNFIGKLLFSEKGIVSAAGEVATCVNSLSGKSCQEYPIESCNQECGGDCVPSTRENVAACKPGTCYDPLEGTCQAGSPQSTCVAHGGTWSGEKYENIPQCREGCCIINSQAKFVTERQCVRSAELLGVKKEFRPDVQTEIACLALGSVQEEGACVFEQEFERTCKFTTRSQCGTMHGDFYSQAICSSPSLNTTCKPQVTTGCFPGKDEVYWFDSCGNRENIFALPKAASWNNVGVLLKNNSCSLGSGTNLLANVKTCVNCNYIAGSVCGRADERNPVSLGEYVCKDLSCIDEQGKKRKHGESWCSYQGAIGEDTAKNRARDTPGSRHFREVCINGEIRTEPCADYRNEICVEAQTPIQGGKFSSAACRINKWQQCFDYNSIVNNPENKGIGKSAMQAKSNQRDLKCEENTDCFVKEVKVGKDFKFDYCVPKYSPGFSLSQRGEGAEIICRQANQKCTVVYVKGLGGWDCKANCECEKKIFAEQMNDLCMSLGDCGAEVNYIGDLTENYKVKKSPKLNSAYLENIKRYANEKLFKGEYADAGDISEFFATLGIPEGLGSASTPGDPAAQFGMAGTVAGMMGVALVWAAGTATGAGILGSLSLAHVGAELLGPTTNGAALTVNPGLSAAGGALAGAAIGFALTSLLLQFTGVGRGLPPAITYSLLAAGTAGGAIAGFGAMGGSAFGAAAGTLLTIGIIIVVVVIIVIVIFKALGIGEVKKVKVTFECKPWQPPRGGADCAKCGSDGKTCSRYSCESLGQTCQLINEETGTPECIDISPNDAAAPSIRFMKELLANYSVEETEFGVRIKQPGSDGCIPESYEPLILGVALDEPGQCRISNSTGVAFEEMESDFGSSLFKRNQTIQI